MIKPRFYSIFTCVLMLLVLNFTVPGAAQLFFPPPMRTGVISPAVESTIGAATFGNTASPSTSLNLGSPGQDRVVAVFIDVNSGNSNTINSVTVAGVPATFRARATWPSFCEVELWTATIPAATTGSQTISASIIKSGVIVGAFKVFQILNSPTEAPAATSGVSSGGQNPSTNISITQYNAVVAGSAGGNNLSSFSWTGLTKVADLVPQAGQVSSYAGANFTAPQTLTVTASANTAPSNSTALLVAAWNPTAH